ncbi:hypothetical protein CTA2_9084 [Colletotrichum tanaceti]|uniref:Uncharacterized protein n=1 Tax=Colletotrichum tanaceti TaxID=1306861 RepID=A0A4U6XCP0_9PEZI|nr:hypothetical protein CTA2_9084 [Colletotrichum tanaceti]TKW51567.1 hypothetical protein CTA1_10329 [Colletotrichum tanaceti]
MFWMASNSCFVKSSFPPGSLNIERSRVARSAHSTVLSIVVIGATGFFADKGLVPRAAAPVIPLGVLAVILACYGGLVAYPSNGAVYTATLIGNVFTAALFPLTWPWSGVLGHRHARHLVG